MFCCEVVLKVGAPERILTDAAVERVCVGAEGNLKSWRYGVEFGDSIIHDHDEVVQAQTFPVRQTFKEH